MVHILLTLAPPPGGSSKAALQPISGSLKFPTPITKSPDLVARTSPRARSSFPPASLQGWTAAIPASSAPAGVFGVVLPPPSFRTHTIRCTHPPGVPPVPAPHLH